jgi:hypothetical protein
METQKASIVDDEGVSIPDALLQVDDPNEFDPYSPEAQAEIAGEETLDQITQDVSTGCQGQNCTVYVAVSLANQSMNYTVGGKTYGPYPVSSGVAGRSTRRWNSHPTNRIYTRYMSATFPGGEYYGPGHVPLGNMPYAMFYSGGFALHGVPQGEWKLFGQKASHGCVRMHPDVAYQLNSFVRHFGPQNTWFYIQ